MSEVNATLVSGYVIENKQKIRPYHILGLLLIFALILSNISAVKITEIHGFQLVSSIYFYPIILIISSIATEVYGFQANLKLIWFASFVNFVSGFLLFMAVLMPGAPGIETNNHFNEVMTMTAKVFFACFVSFILGIYSQAYLLAKFKLKYNGEYLPVRIILSSFVGILLETTIFVSFVYFEFYELSSLKLIAVSIIIKFFYQIFFYPITSFIINYLKDLEKIDHYDFGTNFSLFNIK